MFRCSVIFWLLTVTITNAYSKDSDALRAFGDLRGHMEPCGCNPATDLGGVLRLVSGLDSLQKENSSGLVVSTGNNFTRGELTDKDSIIFQALALISPDAILWNQLEDSHTPWVREQLAMSPTLKERFLLSNAVQAVKVAPLPLKVIVKGEWVIFGYRSAGSGVEAWSADMEKRWKDWAAQHPKATKHLLLYEGDDATLAKIQKSGWFQSVLVANRTPFSEEPSPREKEQPGLLLVLDRYYMVPSFGQGILAPNRSAKPQLVLPGMKSGNCSPLASDRDGCGMSKPRDPSSYKLPGMKTAVPANEGPVLWLDASWQANSRAQPILDTYNKKQKDAFQAKINERLAGLKDTPFAGSEACKSCHAEAYTAWKSSKHSVAFAALEKVGKQADAECVGCHVLGLAEKGGFVSKEHSPHFANVTCENCHGPRMAHTLNPTVHGVGKAQDRCVTCHKEPHSYQFEFATYWPKIQHK